MSTDRTDFRAIPVDISGEEAVENERRFRATVEKAFFFMDNALSKLSNDIGTGGGDCCSNIDGGRADTEFGGIFCPIDGGDASGTANPAP